MKYHPLPAELFIHNRQRLKDMLPKGALAIFNANDVLPTNGDGTLAFKQNSDLFHQCGVDQEETILVIFPDAHRKQHREILFLTETNEHIARWEGEKLSKDLATERSGIENVQWLSAFPALLKSLMSEAETVYLNSNEHLRAKSEVETRDMRFAKTLQADYPLHSYGRLAPLMHRIRAVKSKWEQDVMRQAANITTQAYQRVLKAIKPGVPEYVLEAEFMHEFLSNRSDGFAYTPIIASGANACVLHYIENKDVCNDGELILFDVGAVYANHCCDVTRCYPVSGKFTDRQKEVYNAVLRVQKACFELLKPGVYLDDYHKQVGELMTKELIDLKLLTPEEVKNQDPDWPAYKKYFMHGTSHFIGLDTHDVGLWTEPIQEGMIFTVEPGIYLPEEGLGIRIEDDLIITADGYENMTVGIPKEIDEIEAFMAGKS
ncbi:MAG: aminopeptidase P family protein [Cryomorphaceae bacterium]|nr:aminopeptidase P family protein [Cryomorphaceae bacterium]